MAIPTLSGIDHTLSFLREGYDFLPNRFERLDTDILEARLGLRKTICMRGPEAAAVFYDPDRFRRHGVPPRRVKKTLLGEGGVQGLDGAAHRHRKAMFMGMMGPESVERLVALVEAHWRAALDGWATAGRVELLPAVQEILCRAVCEWTGVPLSDDEAPHRAAQLERIFDSPAAVGPRHWKGRIARRRANAWIKDVVESVRAGRADPPEQSPLHAVAWFREDGELLDPQVAAVEILNLLRPTVAIDRYIVFGAHALHVHTGEMDRIEPAWDWASERDRLSFVHEVRRWYPFFPVAAAEVRTPFEWRGHAFEQDRRVLLDLYGSNHDPSVWDDPSTFRPDRFRDGDIEPFTLIPQGGGDHHRNHRCAGEWITIAVTSAAVRMLTTEMTYRVPDQDLTIDHARIPARPASGFVMEDIRRTES